MPRSSSFSSSSSSCAISNNPSSSSSRSFLRPKIPPSCTYGRAGFLLSPFSHIWGYTDQRPNTIYKSTSYPMLNTQDVKIAQILKRKKKDAHHETPFEYAFEHHEIPKGFPYSARSHLAYWWNLPALSACCLYPRTTTWKIATDFDLIYRKKSV